MLVLLLCCILPLAVYRFLRHRRSLPLPPGPRGLPILGNALQLPTTYTWLAFTKLAKVYGDVIHVSVLGRSFIVLSSREVINDLLEKRGAIYSDRPIIPMAGELGGAARYLPMAPYGSYHNREGRKLLLGYMNPRNAPEQHSLLEGKVARFVSLVSNDPQEVRQHIRWLVASSVFQFTYGVNIENWDHPIIRMVQDAMDDFSKMATPGAWLVDSLPILMHVPEWLPGAGFKRMARTACERGEVMKEVLYDDVRAQIAQGTADLSFAAHLIQANVNPSPEEEDLYKRTAVTVYAAGGDTTVSVLNSFFIVLANHPEIQRKAQAEIDSVVGNARPPSFNDRKHLPYLDAVLQEVHRINPVGPLGLPHKVREEDHYRGYRIPPGATVLANTWAILHDPAVYPDPDKVDPERYLRPREDSINPDPRLFAFGYGRRVCPGQTLADDTLFCTAANILAQFELSDAVSLDGSAIKYDGNGIICHPHPWKCTITRRKTSYQY